MVISKIPWFKVDVNALLSLQKYVLSLNKGIPPVRLCGMTCSVSVWISGRRALRTTVRADVAQNPRRAHLKVVPQSLQINREWNGAPETVLSIAAQLIEIYRCRRVLSKNVTKNEWRYIATRHIIRHFVPKPALMFCVAVSRWPTIPVRRLLRGCTTDSICCTSTPAALNDS
jgi:hypothetical protein